MSGLGDCQPIQIGAIAIGGHGGSLVAKRAQSGTQRSSANHSYIDISVVFLTLNGSGGSEQTGYDQQLVAC